MGRCCAIHRVNTIYIYNDGQGAHDRDRALIRILLEYMETPQYLRRRVFQKQPCLRYVGILPPLRTPHHKQEVQPSEIRFGDTREAFIISRGGQLYAYAGLNMLIPVEGRTSSGKRATIVFTSEYPNLRCSVSEAREAGEYSGYGVREVSSLADLLRSSDKCLKILTSRKGQDIHALWVELKTSLKHSKNLLVGFGSPRRGVFEILGDEGLDPFEIADCVLNVVPGQGVATVRTEEALGASLALVNIARRLG